MMRLSAGFPQRRRRRLADAALISLAMLLPACALQAGATRDAAAPVAASPVTLSSSSAVSRAIEAMFAVPEATVVVGGCSYPIEPLRVFYQSRGDAPVWVDNRGPTARGTALMAALGEAGGDGLDASLYWVDTDATTGTAHGAEAVAAQELGLSTALILYAHDVSIGRTALRPPDPDLRVTPKIIDPTAVLMSAADAPDEAAYIASLAPSGPLYQGLRAGLNRYRLLDQSGVWTPLPAAETLQPGVNSPSVRTLKHVLAATGDLATPYSDTPLYDEALVEGVKQFQRRHQLAATGSINDATRKAFNVPPATRVRQILVNMERRRWMPDDLGNPHIFVNLPDYTLTVMENGTSVMRMNVVIGKETWPTPVFSDLVEYLEFNPHWNVPPTILKKEVLPRMRGNPGYAAASGLRVFQNGKPIDPYAVNWSETSGAGYAFRQDPGERNALGRVKFMLPNEFAVYLHDTPSKSLFQRSMRAYSHGCVRVAQPLELAEFLLAANDANWTRSRIERTIKTGDNRAVTLKKPVPVHLAYFTALPDSNGGLQFRNDVYGKDTTLERTLFASAH
ncbi:MAG: L,D-transpeptidase family protein [Rhodospirillales bacterium]